MTLIFPVNCIVEIDSVFQKFRNFILACSWASFKFFGLITTQAGQEFLNHIYVQVLGVMFLLNVRFQTDDVL